MTAWTSRRTALGAQFLTLAAVPPGALLFTLWTSDGNAAALSAWAALAAHMIAAALAGAAVGRWAGSSGPTVVLTGLLAGLLLAALDTALLATRTDTTHAASLWFAWALSCPMAAVLACSSAPQAPDGHRRSRTHP